MNNNPPINKQRATQALTSIFELIFYGLLGFTMVFVLLQNQHTQEAKTLLGTSMFSIQTDSMHSMMPRGSLIVTHHDDPETLKVGDVITYTTKINGTLSIVTHEIVEVFDNYEGNGRAFSTQGVDNAFMDAEKVYADNVIGTVKLTIPHLGFYIAYIKENMMLCSVIVILLIALKHSVSEYMKEVKKERKPVIDL